ncbi:MAG: hypothetical protein M3Q79_02050 [bacterium]|nr:hypothetical protein [bacterium]
MAIRNYTVKYAATASAVLAAFVASIMIIGNNYQIEPVSATDHFVNDFFKKLFVLIILGTIVYSIYVFGSKNTGRKEKNILYLLTLIIFINYFIFTDGLALITQLFQDIF